MLFCASCYDSDDAHGVRAQHSFVFSALAQLHPMHRGGGGCKLPFPAVPTALRQAVTALLHPAVELPSGNVLRRGCGRSLRAPLQPAAYRAPHGQGPEREPSPGHINHKQYELVPSGVNHKLFAQPRPISAVLRNLGRQPSARPEYRFHGKYEIKGLDSSWYKI